MKTQNHVIYSIDAFERGEKDNSLLHACIAIDSTAQKLFNTSHSTSHNHKECIRRYYWLMQYFLPGINYTKTMFSNITIVNQYGKTIANPDLADLIYHIHRCNETHGKETSKNYQLLPSVFNADGCILKLEEGVVQISERIVWALLAISVFSKVNSSLQSEGDYYLLSCSNNNFAIKDYWGKEKEVEAILTQHQLISVELKGLDGLQNLS